MFGKFAIRSLQSVSRRATVSGLNTARAFSVSSLQKGGDHGAPKPLFVGPGGKDGEIPTDLDQAAGLARVELLAEIEGRDFFDMAPLEMTHLGTKKNPIYVESQDQHRYVGCTGYPVDSHDTIWLTLEAQHDFDRCPECGSVYKLKVVDQPELPKGALLEDNAPAQPEKIAQ